MNRHVRLRIIEPEDYRFLRAAETGGDLSARWRFRGSTPSPEQWSSSTWSGVLAGYLVAGYRSDQPLGIVTVYQANFQDGHAHLAAARLAPADRSPVLALGLGLFLDYVFAAWNFRKLYMDLPEFNLSQFGHAAGRIFEIEGRLTQHLWLDGRYWDQLTVAIYRDVWLKYREPRLRGHQ